MTSSILALRAITATTILRLLRLGEWVSGATLTLLLLATVYLGGWVSGWWYLLLIILVPLVLMVIALAVIVHSAAHYLLPRKLTKKEQCTVRQFTDSLTRLAEVRSTPWPVLLFLVGKDVIRRRQSKYIESVVNDTTSLRASFREVKGMFEE